MVMHRTVKAVLLALVVTVSGFVGTSISQLQDGMTDDPLLQVGLNRFELLPQMLGEALMLVVWYVVFAELPPTTANKARSTAAAAAAVREPLSSSSSSSSKPATAVKSESAFGSVQSTKAASPTVVTVDEKHSGNIIKAAPASAAATTTTTTTTTLAAALDQPLLLVPPRDGLPAPMAAAAAAADSSSSASVWSTLPPWRVLLWWGTLLCWCDILITSGPGRDWISYSADNVLRGLYSPITALLCRWLLRGFNKSKPDAEGPDATMSVRARPVLSWALWGCIAISTCGFLVFGVGASLDGVGWCSDEDDGFSGGSGPGWCVGGFVMTLFHYALMALMGVLEERVMRTHNIHPVCLVGIEGVCGLFWIGVVFGLTAAGGLPQFFLNRGIRDIGPFLHTALWWVTNVPLVLVLAVFNAALLSVTAHAGVVVRSLTNGARLAVSWSGALLVGWDVSPFYVAPGYYMLVAGALLYFLTAESEDAAAAAVVTVAAHSDASTGAELLEEPATFTALLANGDHDDDDDEKAGGGGGPLRAGYGSVSSSAYDSVQQPTTRHGILSAVPAAAATVAPTGSGGSSVVGASAGAAAVAAAVTAAIPPSASSSAKPNGVVVQQRIVVRVAPCRTCGCDEPLHHHQQPQHHQAVSRRNNTHTPDAASSLITAGLLGTTTAGGGGDDDAAEFAPRTWVVALVIACSLAYLVCVQVLGYRTGAIALADTVGCSVILGVVLLVWVVQPHPTFAEAGFGRASSRDAGCDGAAAAAGRGLLLLNNNAPARPRRPLSIVFNRAWGTSAAHRLLSAMLYWGTWAVFLPAFAALSRQCVFDPDTLGSGTGGHPSTAVVQNVLRGFSVVVLMWCVLPLRDVTHAYAKRDMLTRVILDLIDAFELVDRAGLTDPDTGAGLNPNTSTFDSALCGCALLFSGLTLFFVAVAGAAAGLQDAMTIRQPRGGAANAKAAADDDDHDDAAPASPGMGFTGGPGPTGRGRRTRLMAALHPHVRLYWSLLPYVCSLVFNNVPFLVLRVVVWAHTGFVSVALVGKNALGILLCALFIASTLKPALSSRSSRSRSSRSRSSTAATSSPDADAAKQPNRKPPPRG